MKRYQHYLIFGTIALVVGPLLSWASVNYLYEEFPVFGAEANAEGVDFYEYIIENYPIPLYSILGGVLLAIIGVISLIASLVLFIKDRKKDEHQIKNEKRIRSEWTKKRGIFLSLGWGSIIGGSMVLGSVLFFGIPTEEISFFVVADDPTGIFDIGNLIYAGILFGIGYVILRPMKNAKKIVMIMAVIAGLTGIINIVQGHMLGIFGIVIILQFYYFMRTSNASEYFERKTGIKN